MTARFREIAVAESTICATRGARMDGEGGRSIYSSIRRCAREHPRRPSPLAHWWRLGDAVWTRAGTRGETRRVSSRLSLSSARSPGPGARSPVRTILTRPIRACARARKMAEDLVAGARWRVMGRDSRGGGDGLTEAKGSCSLRGRGTWHGDAVWGHGTRLSRLYRG